MPARHFSHTPPDRANELFEKLLTTSDNAIKTRERLFSELKEELELLATLQEQHLFPILRNNKMEDLLQSATQDNEETSTLLNEIDGMPKNAGEFVGKVEQLRKVFQQHIRNDRKELLPAVLEVLSDEEAEAVAERVEGEVVSFEEARRGGATPEGEQAGSVRLVPDDLADVMLTGAERTQVVVQGVQDISRECLHLSQKRLQTNLEGMGKFVECRSVQELAALQLSLLSENFEQTLHNAFRIADLTVQLTEKAAWRPMRQFENTRPHSRDFA